MFQRIGFVLGVLLLLPVLAAAEDARLLRFPDIHGDQIAFSHGGDLWIVSANGGQAHPKWELPCFLRSSREAMKAAR